MNQREDLKNGKMRRSRTDSSRRFYWKVQKEDYEVREEEVKQVSLYWLTWKLLRK